MSAPCPRCKKPIPPGLRALTDGNGLKYHPTCFTCLGCKKLLQGQFYTFENTIYCPECFTKKTAADCVACGRAIGRERLNVNGKTYHPECFACISCKKPISGSFMDGPMCTSCYTEKAAPKCHACAQPISSIRITTGTGETFHKECFTCASCKKELTEYFNHDRKLFCGPCYSTKFAPKCGGCEAPIQGKYVSGKDGA